MRKRYQNELDYYSSMMNDVGPVILSNMAVTSHSEGFGLLFLVISG